MTSEGWSRHAKVYSETAGSFTEHYGLIVVGLLKKHAPPPGQRIKVLEVAAGAGALTQPLALYLKSRGDGSSLLATDFAEEMLKLNKKRVGDHLSDCCSFQVMDGMKLEVEDQKYDFVVSMFGQFLFPDRKKAWAEAARVLKDGGCLLSTSWNTDRENEDKLGEKSFLAKSLGTMAQALPVDKRPSGPPAWRQVGPAAAFRDEVASTEGLGDVAVHVTLGSGVVDPTQVSELLLDSPVVKAMLKEGVEGELGKTIRDAVVSALCAVRDAPGSMAPGKKPEDPMVMFTCANILVAKKK